MNEVDIWKNIFESFSKFVQEKQKEYKSCALKRSVSEQQILRDLN